MKLLCAVACCFISWMSVAQNVGIGTNAPVALLHVANNSVLFTAPATLPFLPALPPISGPGNRTFGTPTKPPSEQEAQLVPSGILIILATILLLRGLATRHQQYLLLQWAISLMQPVNFLLQWETVFLPKRNRV